MDEYLKRALATLNIKIKGPILNNESDLINQILKNDLIIKDLERQVAAGKRQNQIIQLVLRQITIERHRDEDAAVPNP